MEHFKCAYRDPKSPLTPLTPLADNKAFNFNISVKPCTTPTSALTPKAYAAPSAPRYPEDYQSVRQAFESSSFAVKLAAPPAKASERVKAPPAARAPPLIKEPPQPRHSTPAPKCRLPFSPCQPVAAPHAGAGGGGVAGRPVVVSDKQRYRRTSPVQPRPLDPTVHYVLNKIGLLKYADVFQREDLDFDVFCMLTDRELLQLGIRSETDRMTLLQVARWLKK